MTLYKATWHGEEGRVGRKHCYVIADSLMAATETATEWGSSEPHETLRLTAPLLDARVKGKP